MNYVEKVLDGVQSVLRVNPATFSGAVDIIVVQHPDGTYRSSSWHLRFGKFQVLSTREAQIAVAVNETMREDIKIQLGALGEGYFVHDIDSVTADPAHASIFGPDGTIVPGTASFAVQTPPAKLSTSGPHSPGSSAGTSPLSTSPPLWNGESPLAQVATGEGEPTAPISFRRPSTSPAAAHSSDFRRSRSLESSPLMPSPLDGPLPFAPSAGVSVGDHLAGVSATAPPRSSSAAPSTPSGTIPTATKQPSAGGWWNPWGRKSKASATLQSPVPGQTVVPEPPAVEEARTGARPRRSSSFDGRNPNHSHPPAETPAADPPTFGPAPTDAEPTPGPGLAASASSGSLSASKPLHGSSDTEDSAPVVVPLGLASPPEGSEPSLTGPDGQGKGSWSSSVGSFFSLFKNKQNASGKRSAPSVASPPLPGGTSAQLGPNPWGDNSETVTDEYDRRLAHGVTDPISISSPHAFDHELAFGEDEPREPLPSSSSSDDETDYRDDYDEPTAILVGGGVDPTLPGPPRVESPPSRDPGPGHLSPPLGDSLTLHISSGPADNIFQMDEGPSSSSAALSMPPTPAIGATAAVNETPVQPAPEGLKTSKLIKQHKMELSKCGQVIFAPDYDGDDARTVKEFRKHLVTWEKFSTEPELVFHPGMVFRLENKLYPWAVVAPFVTALLAFQRPLPTAVIDTLYRKWRAEQAAPLGGVQPKAKATSTLGSSVSRWFSRIAGKRGEDDMKRDSSSGALEISPMERSGDAGDHQVAPTGLVSTGSANSLSSASSTGAAAVADQISAALASAGVAVLDSTLMAADGNAEHKKYLLSLHPTSAQLSGLKLQPGVNKITFTVDSRLQGKQVLTSSIYLWESTAKVVISDIDGTITKTDVFGQIFPVFGKDWSHIGVAELFSNIRANGYNIVYLTARAIGAAKITKEYLSSLTQSSQNSVHRLPDGPVLMSPDRLLNALNREVIQRRPEQFKIACLNDVKNIFPTSNTLPYYAGFGNRHTDAVSYTAVGISKARIFIINPQGEIECISKSLRRSYSKINELVEQMFPAYHPKEKAKAAAEEQFNDWQYWKPLSSSTLEDLEKELGMTPKPASSQQTAAQKKATKPAK